ncbi:MAG TPA: bifunctional riboflavin kinase/FAD synthetase [Solirubrobacteraceae bacterium]|nr:bifunctional riboflavin kinase/FAD synthetase [Solirubrobacteraceae bacterium]
MKATRLADVRPRPRRVAVGTFDGVHLGHREVIRGADTVLTFDPHPTTVIRPGASPKLLTDPARKGQLIASLGVEELVVIAFDAEFAARSAQNFVDDVLVGALGATHVSVGENFRFGHKAQGDADLLAADDRFATRVVQLLEIDGEVVSSSHIRGLVQGGAIEYAGQLLGDPFTLTGEVVHGDERGRELGYPTANLVPDPRYVTPAHGVYAAHATTAAGETWPAAVSVGVRPTFVTGRGELIEAYLLDFSGDLYGTRLEIAFLKRLRGEKRFDSVDALIDQMALDVDAARSIHDRGPA